MLVDKINKPLFRDPSGWSLLVSNLIAIFVIFINGVTLTTVLWVYLIQSLIIGIFTFFQLIGVRVSDPIKINMDGKIKVLNKTNKIFYALEFLIGYGIFHGIYIFFVVLISSYGQPGPSEMAINFVAAFREGTNTNTVFVASIVFLINQIFSYFYNKKDVQPEEFGRIGNSAFNRILPMHLFLIFGVYFFYQSAILIFFLILKTLIDLYSHNVRYSKFSRPASPSAPTANVENGIH